MPTPLFEVMLKLADVLHWLGRHHECNVIILLSRLLKKRGIDDIEGLQKGVGKEEA